MDTPICDFARDYAAKGAARLHMPGHKGTTFLGCEALDITEIPGADVLYDANGIIAASEANAARLFGSAKTLYSAEGSSLCIRAMLYLALLHARETRRAPLIVAGRNAHRTFVSAAALLGLDVAWLYSGEPAQSVVSCAITASALDAALSESAKKPAAVYITSPDYLGNRADIAALAAVCHAHATPLLVDNAHGAYLRFLPESLHPLDLGADLCCDSAHKTLPVLTGGAYLHLAKTAPASLLAAAERAMALFASTSPSYLILQSLDAANRYLAENYVNSLADTVSRLDALRRALRADGWTLAGNEPLKLTVAPKPRGYRGVEAAGLLERGNIRCEFSDPDYIVFMFTPETPPGAYDALLAALRALPPRAPLTDAPPPLGKPQRVFSPREAALAPFETIPLAHAPGRVLAAPSVSCPPAVPAVVCGERVDEAAIRVFEYYGIQTCDVVNLIE